MNECTVIGCPAARQWHFMVATPGLRPGIAHDRLALMVSVASQQQLPPSVEVVIEIPRGSFLKRGSTGQLDFVSPFPCPYNYGSIHQYIGGEGDFLDAVVLANYFHEHAPFAVKAFAAGKHVMSECAACHTPAEGVALARAFEAAKDRVYMFAENYPFMAHNARLARFELRQQTANSLSLGWKTPPGGMISDALIVVRVVINQKESCYVGRSCRRFHCPLPAEGGR